MGHPSIKHPTLRPVRVGIAALLASLSLAPVAGAAPGSPVVHAAQGAPAAHAAQGAPVAHAAQGTPIAHAAQGTPVARTARAGRRRHHATKKHHKRHHGRRHHARRKAHHRRHHRARHCGFGYRLHNGRCRRVFVAHTGSVSVPANGQDLLSNSLFGSSVSGWTGGRADLSHVLGGDAPIGNGYVAQVSWDPSAPSSGLPADQYGIFSASVRARAGWAYTATALVRGSSGIANQPIQVYVQERSPQGTVVATWPSAVYNLANNAYTRVTATEVAEHTGDTIDTYIARAVYPGYQGLESGESFNVDDYQLIGTAPAYIPSGNLTINPSFESGTQGWAGNGASVGRLVDTTAPDGNNVALVTANSGAGFGLHSTAAIGASAGYTYDASAWFRGDGVTAGKQVTLTVEELNSSGAVVGQATSSPLTISAGSYQEVSVSYTASGADVLQVIAQAPGSSSPGERFYVDAITLTSTAPCSSKWGTFGAGNWPAACWRPYSDSSFLNSPIAPNAPVVPDSQEMINGMINGAVLGDPQDATAWGYGQSPASIMTSTEPDPTKPDGYVDPWIDGGSHPTFWSKASDPSYVVSCTEPWGPNGGTACPIANETQQQPLHLPTGALPAGYFDSSQFDHDAHMTVVDQANNLEYDMWQVQSITPGNPGHIVVSWGGSAAVVGPNATGNGPDANATTSHLALMGGIIRAQELQAGVINHALFIDIPCSLGDPTDAGGAVAVAPIAPYGHADHVCNDPSTMPSQASEMVKAYPHGVPMGTHFRLNMTVGQIEALPSSEYPTWEKAIMRALSVYGGYAADASDMLGNWGFQVEGGTTYTSFTDPSTGKPYLDQMVKVAQGAGVQPESYFDNYCPSQRGASPFQAGSCNGQATPDAYSLNLDNVDWGRLQVIEPGH